MYGQEFTRENLRLLQAMPLEEKVQHALTMIENFYIKEHGQCYISFSGGKDSTVLAWLIQHEYNGKLIEDVPLVFSDTGLEYPEIRKFALNTMGAIRVAPELNYIEVIQKYGYPLISKQVSNAIENARITPGGSRWKRMHGKYTKTNGQRSQFDTSRYLPLMDLPIKISEKCCKAMKKSPMHKYERQTGRHPITGTTAAEGLMREQSWIGRGCNTYSISGRGAPKSNPLSPWLEQDILQYIKTRNVPICSVYGEIVYSDGDGLPMETSLDANAPLHCTGCQRTGCIFCPFGMHREKGLTRYQRLKQTHPRQYEFALGGGEWTKDENGRPLWTASKGGLGYAKVFDWVNEIYGKEFYRYE